MSDNSRVELGRPFSLFVLAAFGVLWALIAAALILLGVQSVDARSVEGVLWCTLGGAAAGAAIYHWRVAWTRRVPRWFTELIQNS